LKTGALSHVFMQVYEKKASFHAELRSPRTGGWAWSARDSHIACDSHMKISKRKSPAGAGREFKSQFREYAVSRMNRQMGQPFFEAGEPIFGWNWGVGFAAPSQNALALQRLRRPSCDLIFVFPVPAMRKASSKYPTDSFWNG
jgi:hypothetical protein